MFSQAWLYRNARSNQKARRADVIWSIPYTARRDILLLLCLLLSVSFRPSPLNPLDGCLSGTKVFPIVPVRNAYVVDDSWKYLHIALFKILHFEAENGIFLLLFRGPQTLPLVCVCI